MSRRRRTRSAHMRRQGLEQGLFDQLDDDDGDDDNGDPNQHAHVLAPANKFNLDHEGRCNALWQPAPEFNPSTFIRDLSPKQLEEVLVDVLLIGQLHNFGYEPSIFHPWLPPVDVEKEVGVAAKQGAATKAVPPSPPAAHSEFFERGELEKMIAMLVHERCLAAIQLQSLARCFSARSRR